MASEPQALPQTSISTMGTACYDVVVLGAGSMGLATAYSLSRKGRKVALLDRYNPPHTFGSHHGETRLFRMAYAEGPAYVPLLRDARRLWLELEAHMAEIGPPHGPVELFAKTGVINVSRRSSSLLGGVQQSLDLYQIPHEWCTAAEAMTRWSGLSLPDEYEVLYDKFGGVLFSERCLQSYKAASLLQGATLLTGGELKKVTVQADGITVEWGTERITAASLVITMGAGTGPFLRTWFPEWQIPLQPVRKTVAWFQASPTDSDPVSNLPYKANEFPGFLIESEKGLFYGFPDFGEGVKVGRHDGGEPCDMDSVNRDFFANPEDERELRHFLRKFFPEATEFVRGSVCMYTLTPDEHFVIDFHPEYGNVVLGAGFSGHGFKFASVVGEVLGCMATKEGVPYDLSLFRADRWESPRR